MAVNLPRDLIVRIRGNSTDVERAASRSSAALRRIGTSAATAAKSIAGIGLAAAGVGYAVKRGLLDPYAKSEEAFASLSASLAASGQQGADAVRMIADEASRLQSLTRFGDENLVKAISTLSTLAPALNAEELTKAQTALVAIATTFTKGDLESAASLLGKTLGSTTNALSRYGIQVETAGSASEKLASILENDVVGSAFAVAEAQGNTLAGTFDKLKNGIGDLQESFGEVVAKVLGLTGGAQTVVDRLRDWNNSIQANMDAWVAWGKVVVEVVKGTGVTFYELVRIAFDTGQTIGRIFDIAAYSMVYAFQVAKEKVTVSWQDLGNFLADTFDWANVFRSDEPLLKEVLPSEETLDYIKAQSAGIVGDMESIFTSSVNIASSWMEVADSIRRANEASGNSSPITQQNVRSAPPRGGADFIVPGIGDLGPVLDPAPLLRIQETLEPLQRQYRVLITLSQEFAASITEAGQRWAENFATAFAASLFEGAAAFKRFAESILFDIARMITQMLVFRALAGLGVPGFAPLTGIVTGGSDMAGAWTSGIGTAIPVGMSAAAPSGGMTFSLDLSRMPAATDPRQSARDGQWLDFLGHSMREWTRNGGKLGG